MAQRSALRHAAARSSAPAPRARVEHAHQRCGPARHPSDQRARKEHCSPHHSTCAHRSLSRALLRHVLVSCTITDRMHAPTKHQCSAHTHARRCVQPALPVLGTHKMYKDCPAHCSSRSCLFLSTFMSKSPASAVEDESTDTNRSVAADAPAPAAALAAPAQRSHARQRAASSRAVSNFVTRTTCHVPKPATFHTHTDHTLLLTPTDYSIYHHIVLSPDGFGRLSGFGRPFSLGWPTSLQHSNCTTRQ